MRRITIWLVSTITVVVLLFSYRTSTSGPGGTSVVGAGAPGVVGPTAAAGSGTTSAPNTGTGTGGGKTTTVNGTVAQTRWGPVQVQVKISGGKITDVTAIVYPNGNGRDDEINAYALPILHDEVLSAQSAQIDTVSGATVTSDGYLESLQAALTAAHFGQ
jgi:uncharacterized protein with FMN-binding domain